MAEALFGSDEGDINEGHSATSITENNEKGVRNI